MPRERSLQRQDGLGECDSALPRPRHRFRCHIDPLNPYKGQENPSFVIPSTFFCSDSLKPWNGWLRSLAGRSKPRLGPSIARQGRSSARSRPSSSRPGRSNPRLGPSSPRLGRSNPGLGRSNSRFGRSNPRLGPTKPRLGPSRARLGRSSAALPIKTHLIAKGCG